MNDDTQHRPVSRQLAERAGLSYVTDHRPGIRYRACGPGFTYLLPDGDEARALNAAHVNEGLFEALDISCSAKNFRPWRASVPVADPVLRRLPSRDRVGGST